MCREICDGAGAGVCNGPPSICFSFSYFSEKKKNYVVGTQLKRPHQNTGAYSLSAGLICFNLGRVHM